MPLSTDQAVILAAADYLKAYAIDTLIVSFLFCYIGFFNGCGKTKFVMVQGIASAFGGVSEALYSYGIPVAGCSDGPSGIRLDTGKEASLMPTGTVIACTWNKELTRELMEFEGSELAIDIDRDALTLERDKDGNDITIHSKLQNRLYRKVDMNEESTYEVFSPTIRDGSLFNGLNNILMRIEDLCEMARGTLSDVNAEARTATEITVLKQRSYAANAQLQKSLEDTLKDVVYIMDVYTTLYELAPDGDYDVSFEWDDSIQVDKESEMNKRLALVNAGISNKVEFRMWYFGETEQQAIQALSKGQSYNNYEMINSPEMQQNEE